MIPATYKVAPWLLIPLFLFWASEQSKASDPCCSNNLIKNGSFETGTWAGNTNFAGGSNNATDLPPVSIPATLSNWTQDAATWVQDASKAADGNRFIRLKTDPLLTYNACAEQSFSILAATGTSALGKLVKGKTYTFRFKYAAFDPNDPTAAIAGNSQVIIEQQRGANAIQILDNSISSPIVSWSNLPNAWQTYSINIFVPSTGGSTLKLFISTNQLGRGLLIDDVSVCESKPIAGADVTLPCTSGSTPTTFDLTDATPCQTWSVVRKPTGSSVIIDAATGIITNLDKRGQYAFGLTSTNGFSDTMKVTVPSCSSPCPNMKLMYICGTNKPNDANAFDHGIVHYFQNLGYSVTPALVMADGTYRNPETGLTIQNVANQPATLNDFNCILYSHSAYFEFQNDVGGFLNKLKTTTADVLTFDYGMLPQMEMAQTSDYRHPGGSFWIEDNLSPMLPAGLTDESRVIVYNDTLLIGADGYKKITSYGRGFSPNVQIGAYLENQPASDNDNAVTYLGYKKGTTMLNGFVAPGNRYFLGILIEGASNYQPEIDVFDANNYFTAQGKALIDASFQQACSCACVPLCFPVTVTRN
jgi:hypothetical protein